MSDSNTTQTAQQTVQQAQQPVVKAVPKLGEVVSGMSGFEVAGWSALGGAVLAGTFYLGYRVGMSRS